MWPSLINTVMAERTLELASHQVQTNTTACGVDRMTKEIAKVEGELAKVKAKLADPTFTGKVPAAVLEDHRNREANGSAQLAKLQEMLKTLG